MTDVEDWERRMALRAAGRAVLREAEQVTRDPLALDHDQVRDDEFDGASPVIWDDKNRPRHP